MDVYYEYPTTERARVSDLEDAISEDIRKRKEYKDRPDGDFTICIYEVRLFVFGSEYLSPYACFLQCIQLPVPSAPTTASQREAYEVINDDWLEHNGRPVSHRRPVADLKENSVLAVISTSTREALQRLSLITTPKTSCRAILALNARVASADTSVHGLLLT